MRIFEESPFSDIEAGNHPDYFDMGNFLIVRRSSLISDLKIMQHLWWRQVFQNKWFCSPQDLLPSAQKFAAAGDGWDHPLNTRAYKGAPAGKGSCLNTDSRAPNQEWYVGGCGGGKVITAGPSLLGYKPWKGFRIFLQLLMESWELFWLTLSEEERQEHQGWQWLQD